MSVIESEVVFSEYVRGLSLRFIKAERMLTEHIPTYRSGHNIRPYYRAVDAS